MKCILISNLLGIYLYGHDSNARYLYKTYEKVSVKDGLDSASDGRNKFKGLLGFRGTKVPRLAKGSAIKN